MAKHNDTRLSPGEKYGEWTIISNRIKGDRFVFAKCSCGTERRILYSNLLSGNSTRCRECGNKARSRVIPPRRLENKDFPVGRKIDQWTVIAEPIRSPAGGDWLVPVQCDCGHKSNVRRSSLGVTSRQCRVCSRTIHGDSHKSMHTIWLRMIERCHNPDDGAYANYGGRGIEVCAEWRDSYLQFKEDVGQRPSAEHSLDRIDNDSGYRPTNIRWATQKEQMRNTRRNVFLEYNGEKKCVAEWAQDLDISQFTIHRRLKLGWSIERTLTAPVRGSGN